MAPSGRLAGISSETGNDRPALNNTAEDLDATENAEALNLSLMSDAEQIRQSM